MKKKLKKSGKKVKFFTKFTKIYNFILPHVYTFLIFQIRFHLIMACFNFVKKKGKNNKIKMCHYKVKTEIEN